MDKSISFLGYMFLLIEIVVIISTYYHFVKQYNYAMKRYSKQQERSKIFVKVLRKSALQNIVVSNRTEPINKQDVENKLNYPTLYFYLNNKEIKSIPLWDEKTFIGRSTSDDIFIDEPTVSRGHCFITKETDKYYINRGIAKNPLSINKRQFADEKKELFDGDSVSMGDGKISFVFQM